MFNSLSKQDKKKLITAIFIIAVILFCIIFKLNQNSGSDGEYNYVHFLDVGQGDCTVIETVDGKFAVIDASTQDASDKIIDYLKSKGVKEIEFIIFTHPHEDHIGCGDEIIDEFKVNTVYMNNRTENTSCYEDLIKSIKNSKSKNGTKVYNPKKGQTFNLSDIEFTVISDGNGYEDTNNSSICVKMELGESSFLFTGDAEKKVENDILNDGLDIDSDVFKCGHHGSSTSNSDEFLDKVSPDICIVSCGKDNSYGHPHVEVVKALNERNIEMRRTDKDGDTVIAFNEESIYIL